MDRMESSTCVPGTRDPSFFFGMECFALRTPLFPDYCPQLPVGQKKSYPRSLLTLPPVILASARKGWKLNNGEVNERWIQKKIKLIKPPTIAGQTRTGSAPTPKNMRITENTKIKSKGERDRPHTHTHPSSAGNGPRNHPFPFGIPLARSPSVAV